MVHVLLGNVLSRLNLTQLLGCLLFGLQLLLLNELSAFFLILIVQRLCDNAHALSGSLSVSTHSRVYVEVSFNATACAPSLGGFFVLTSLRLLRGFLSLLLLRLSSSLLAGRLSFSTSKSLSLNNSRLIRHFFLLLFFIILVILIFLLSFLE